MIINPLFVILQAAETVADSTEVEVSPIKEGIEHLINTPGSELWSELLNKAVTFGLKVVGALLIYMLGAWLIRIVKKLLHRVFTKRETEKSVASFITSLVSITLTILLIIITIGILGVNTTSIAALLAAGGVAIGMALSGMLQNFAGGIMIIIFKPFKTGDFIFAQGNSGTVTHVSIVSTTITTVDNRAVIIPNGTLYSGTIDNYSQNDFRRVDWSVGVCYGTDSQKVIDVITKICGSDARILNAEQGAPADPFIAVSELADSSINFTVRVWVKTADYWGVFFDGNKKIYDELPKNGIQFPFPQLDVHMIK